MMHLGQNIIISGQTRSCDVKKCIEKALVTVDLVCLHLKSLAAPCKPKPLLSRLGLWPAVALHLMSIVGVHVLALLSLHLCCSLHLCSQSFFCSCVLSVLVGCDVFVGD